MASPANPLHLAQLMESILNTAYGCLAGTTNGLPKDYYISHGAPAVDCCDILVVYPEWVRPSVGFGDARYFTGSRIVDRCGNVGRVLDLVIELWRPCTPTLKDSANDPFPAATEMHDYNVKLLEDAWTLQCCVAAAHCAGTLVTDEDGQCLEVAWGDLQPLGPQGACSGWRWLITVELENCACN